jgi:hypothetical protein
VRRKKEGEKGERDEKRREGRKRREEKRREGRKRREEKGEGFVMKEWRVGWGN